MSFMTQATQSESASAASINVNAVAEASEKLKAQLQRRIIGQQDVVEQLLTSFFAGGHVLLMGVPGLAKTLLVRSFSEALGLKFNRIQFTPDLMPSDVTGTDVIHGGDGNGSRGFDFLSGPIFANIVLADEINRTPPKTQASLLEAMEEHQVSNAGQVYRLPEPFFVMATQNPIEQEGTYVLPLAALDRFLFKVDVDYPTSEDELEMLFQTTSRPEEPLQQVMSTDEVIKALECVRSVTCSDAVLKYATTIVRESRPSQTRLEYVKEHIEVGGSPRAIQALVLAGKARAAMAGRSEVRGTDIRASALPALRHRIVPSFHASAESIGTDEIITKLVGMIPRPMGDIVEMPPEPERFDFWKWLVGKPRPRRRTVAGLETPAS